MSVAKMSKIQIYFKSNHQTAVIETLQDLGIVQITEPQKVIENLESLSLDSIKADNEYLRAGIKFCLDFLTAYDKERGTFLDRLAGAKMPVMRSQVKKIVKTTKYPTIIKAVQDLETKINKQQNEIETLKEAQTRLRPWRQIPFIINHDQAPQEYDFILASHGNEGYSRVLAELRNSHLDYAGEMVDSNGKDQYFYIIYQRQLSKKIGEILQKMDCEVFEFEEMNVLTSDYLESISIKIKELENLIAKLEHEATLLTKHMPDLRIGYDYYNWVISKLEALTKARGTSSTLVLSAWVENFNIDKLERQLKVISPETAVALTEPEPDDEPPVNMRNKKWAAPFEAITGIYGSPQYNEPDPTPWLAPFFIIFFGLALTDTGYGIILSILAVLGLKFLAQTQEAKKLMKVLIITGASTAILGILFGGWMGIQLDSLPQGTIKSTLLGIRLVDPITNPIAVLLLSFALGTLQVIVGLFINLRWQLRHNNAKEAWLGSGLWLAFLIILVIWVLGKAAVLPEAWLPVITNILLIAGAGVIIAGFRKTKNWLLKLPVGVIGLYDLVGYFSDVLSYSRLLALGLGTGIIAMVVNLIASLANNMVPYVGWVFALIILIGGHAFNIAINVLGAYIHSSRLQFVEFFPKFMEGGGKVFSPFKKENQFIRLEN